MYFCTTYRRLLYLFLDVFEPNKHLYINIVLIHNLSISESFFSKVGPFKIINQTRIHSYVLINIISFFILFFIDSGSTAQASSTLAENHSKRSFVQPRPTNTIRTNHHIDGKRGVVIKEHVSWSHLPENQAAKLTLLNVNEIIGPEDARTRRQEGGMVHHQLPIATTNSDKISYREAKGDKRIFKKIRKIAHNIMKKIKNKNQKKI